MTLISYNIILKKLIEIDREESRGVFRGYLGLTRGVSVGDRGGIKESVQFFQFSSFFFFTRWVLNLTQLL